MRASDWLGMCRSWGKVVLAAGMPYKTDEEKARYDLVRDLLECLRLLSAHIITTALLADVRFLLTRTLTRWAQLAPKHEHAMIVHLLSHIPDQLAYFGPARSTWMFPVERFFSYCNRAMKQRQHPEANLYQVWASIFLVGGDSLDQLSEAEEDGSEWFDILCAMQPSRSDLIVHWPTSKGQVVELNTDLVKEMLLRTSNPYWELHVAHLKAIAKRKERHHNCKDIEDRHVWANLPDVFQTLTEDQQALIENPLPEYAGTLLMPTRNRFTSHSILTLKCLGIGCALCACLQKSSCVL